MNEYVSGAAASTSSMLGSAKGWLSGTLKSWADKLDGGVGRLDGAGASHEHARERAGAQNRFQRVSDRRQRNAAGSERVSRDAREVGRFRRRRQKRRRVPQSRRGREQHIRGGAPTARRRRGYVRRERGELLRRRVRRVRRVGGSASNDEADEYPLASRQAAKGSFAGSIQSLANDFGGQANVRTPSFYDE